MDTGFSKHVQVEEADVQNFEENIRFKTFNTNKSCHIYHMLHLINSVQKDTNSTWSHE